MKKISKICLASAALLLLWACFDFYHYFVIGTRLTQYYEESDIISRLVGSSLFSAAAKILLAVFAAAVGYRKSRLRKTISSAFAISLLLCISVMGTWLTSMACLTVVTAQEIYDAMYEQSRGFADSIGRYSLLSEFYDKDYSRYHYQYERPDFLEYLILDAIGGHTSSSYHTSGHYGSSGSKLIRDLTYNMDTAVLFYDSTGNLIHDSRDDILYFDYYTQDEWDSGMDSTSGLHYGWIDIGDGKEEKDNPYSLLRDLYRDTGSLRDISIMKIKGSFEGTQLKPSAIYYATDDLVLDVIEGDSSFWTGPDSYSYLTSDVDKTGNLDWQLLFDNSGENGEIPGTFYVTHPKMWDYKENILAYDGQTYESLAALTESLDLPLKDSADYYGNSISALNEILLFDRYTGSEFSSEEYLSTGKYTIDFYLVTAMRGSPLACAMSALRNIYIATGLFALILIAFVRGAIIKRLIKPISDIANNMKGEWKSIYRPENAPRMWREAEKLSMGYDLERDRRRMKDNEIMRLDTALKFAKNAEQNRRQMTSNIAHELKTPLAVIHSYAEGLKEHIAEDKRDKYINVILSETERTVRIVLEMLDLSRLEAGKVKLSRDEFSLISLTKSVFEKLGMAAQAKKLQIDFDFPQDFTVMADESRIGQVIENFASNAIKYTPANGHILVKIRKNHSGTVFTMENDSQPFSDEALEKIWDTFYRANSSRSNDGTGLGLAISKNIIELHGGKCSVRNTNSGVEFSFVI